MFVPWCADNARHLAHQVHLIWREWLRPRTWPASYRIHNTKVQQPPPQGIQALYSYPTICCVFMPARPCTWLHATSKLQGHLKPPACQLHVLALPCKAPGAFSALVTKALGLSTHPSVVAGAPSACLPKTRATRILTGQRVKQGRTVLSCAGCGWTGGLAGCPARCQVAAGGSGAPPGEARSWGDPRGVWDQPGDPCWACPWGPWDPSLAAPCLLSRAWT